ncbi:MAG: ATP-binding protein [Gammaproteobacteria bacterium]|nr:ATP-binding protein [Gammaproteobacteria bacterium]MDE0258496.1 ATP-binding protein [Gammaproteobacteria bacterium]
MTDDSASLRDRIETLERRVSELSRAAVRIGASLDPEAVLQEVVDSARALTGARYGLIATVDEAGRPRRFVGSGITADEYGRLKGWSDGPRLFGHLAGLPGALNFDDIPGYLGHHGFGTGVLPYGSARGARIDSRGACVGYLFVIDKEDGGGFTAGDEEVLPLFASQAGTAIANARAFRDERRARDRLEALVATSPVGVVVLDAGTGGVVSMNREAERIVAGLRVAGRSVEELAGLVTCRRADGSEVALADFPLERQLRDAETVRAEEIELAVPDGRSVRTLINSTPIHGPDGEVESVVVTMQDLAPFEELERMRTEFLAIVSHELRTPLTSIQGSAGAVLRAEPGFAKAEMMQFFRIIEEQAARMSGLIRDLLDAGRIATGTLSVSPEPSDVAPLVDVARRSFVSGGGRHRVAADLPEDLPRVMADRERGVQVLSNLFSNAARHSASSSPIRVSARRDGGHVAISVSDQGRGIAPEQLPHLFRKHSGGDGGTRGPGSGLGLAICKGLVEAHGGRIRAESAGPGRGSCFTFTVPVAEEAVAPTGIPPSARSPGVMLQEGREPVTVLVVDDDPEVLRYVRDVLRAAGYATLSTGDHRELAGLIRAEKPHLVLLDLMLRGTDGIKLMEQVPELADQPVVFISAYGRDETVARALEAGAADYIVKPFSPTELTARVRAALRGRGAPARFELGALSIDYDTRRVTVSGRPVKLTATEYEVLRVLSRNAGRVSTYRSLLRQAWSKHPGRVNPKLVHAVVQTLRRKLGEDGSSAAWILNERGLGYRMPGPKCRGGP